MGNSESQQQVQEQTPQQKQSQVSTQQSKQFYHEDEEFFVTSDLSRIKLQGEASDAIYLWIDPRIYNDENSKNLKIFKQRLPQIQQFSSIGSLQNQLAQIDTNNLVIVISAASLPDQHYKIMNAERRISQIVLFCQNQQRAKLLMSNFSKIKAVGFTSVQVLQKITQLNKSRPQKGLISNSLLFMTEDDAAVMNKYRLNYYCLTNQKNKTRAKTDFVNLVRKLYPEQKEIIEDFNNKYMIQFSNEDQRYQQSLEWMFRNCFYFNSVANLPKVTTDPRKLAYLRLPVKDIYETILYKYRQGKKRPQSLYIVVELTDDQQQKLTDNEENFLIFTTFVRGFTDERKANEEFKRLGPKGWKFDVLLARKLAQQLDFGYIIQEGSVSGGGNVIFNLYNFFKIVQLTVKARRGTIEYGSLAEAYKMRQDPNARLKLLAGQKNLLRNYDYLQELMKKIRNQGNVLQLSGYYKECIEIYNRKLEEITRTNKPAAMLDEYKIEKGDALKMSEEYELAQNQYKSVQTDRLKLVAKVRLIELYWLRKIQSKAQAAIQQLQSEVELLKTYGLMEDYFRAKNYIGLNLLRKDKNRQSNKYFKSLRGQISIYYDYKVQGIPLVHQINRNLALSQTKMNNHAEALNILNSTRAWLKSSEGKGPGMILTEKMIQNVYQSSGDKQSAQQKRQEIDKLILEQSTVDVNLDASFGALKVQQSIQQSLVNIDLDYSSVIGKKEQTKRMPILEQSAVQIDF